jgi:hypothetical protein
MSRVIPSSKRHFPRESRVINIAGAASQPTEGAQHPSNVGTAYVLFETTFDALEHNALHLGARDGAPITLLSLPYANKPA